MALPTGSGTETLHTHSFEEVDGTQSLIVGVQHHMYTVLSVVVYCVALHAVTHIGKIMMIGYYNHGGDSGAEITIAQFNIQATETYVWKDKFSFNGYEPTGTDVFSTAAHQTANAAQAGSTAQYLKFGCDHANDNYDITVTYLDQDWS